MHTDETQDAQHTPASISDPEAAPFVDMIVDVVADEDGPQCSNEALPIVGYSRQAQREIDAADRHVAELASDVTRAALQQARANSTNAEAMRLYVEIAATASHIARRF